MYTYGPFPPRWLPEVLLKVHGSIEDLYKTRASPIPVTVGSFETLQKHKAQSDDSSEGRDEDRPNPIDCWWFGGMSLGGGAGTIGGGEGGLGTHSAGPYVYLFILEISIYIYTRIYIYLFTQSLYYVYQNPEHPNIGCMDP